MKILITGGAGFIGSHLVEHYQNQAHEVVVLDNFRTGHRSNLSGLRHHLVEGSILDSDLLHAAMQGVSHVFHLAAMISVPESVLKPRECVELNAIGTLNVLEAARQAGVTKLVLASSAAIYGDNPLVPKDEGMLPEPRSPYAVTKLDGEYYCDLYQREGWLSTAALRFFNVFGPRQDPQSPYAAAIPIFIQRALAQQDLTIFGDGTQTRDFVFVKDIVKALAHLAESSDFSGVYNCGYGKQITIRAVAEQILQAAGSSAKIQYAPIRLGDVKHSRASVDKLAGTGFVPDFSLEEGLRRTLRYFQEHQRAS